MAFSDFVTQQKTTSTRAAILKEHKRAGTLGDTVKFYPPTLNKTAPVADTVDYRDPENYFQRTAKSAEALGRGDITFRDVLREVPGATKDVTVGIAETLAPALTKFFETTGSIFGEGLAYATDENVRKYYKEGNLDILPTITEVTLPKLAKYTFAAGIETAIFRSFPNIAKQKLASRGGAGAIQGLGFAISEGLANDRSPEEIMQSLPLYGLGGGVIGVVTPYLVPLLRAEATKFPKELRTMLRNLSEEARPPAPRNIGVQSLAREATPVPISTPNTRYQAYLRSQGYEPYVPESQLPVIDAGDVPRPRNTEPSVEFGSTPKVFDSFEYESRLAGYEQYTPNDELLTIDEFSRVKDNTGKQLRMVPEPSVTRETPITEPTVVRETPTQSEPVYPTPQGGTEIKPKTTTVPGAQLPVGSGGVRTSRLEARMRETLGDVQPGLIERENIATYQQMNKADQIASAAKFVAESPDDALAVLLGKRQPPNGLLYNSIALALEKQAELEGNAGLITKLASLRSTRYGQEISILTEADPTGVTNNVHDIIKARATRKLKDNGIKVEREANAITEAKKLTKKEAEAADKVINKSQVKVEEVEQFINDILC